MRQTILALLLMLAACAPAHRADTCSDPELSREAILSIVKEHMRAHGDDTSAVDNPATVVEIVDDGCDQLVRLIFPTPTVGNWIIYTVSREGRVTDVYRGM